MISALTMVHAGMQAKVRLPHILSDNMVVQQNADVRLWGSAKPNSTVKVTVSWSGDAYSAKAGRDGEWQLKVKTPKADNKPLTVKFDDGDGEVALNNLLAGEVWVCAGQSNMEMPIKGFENCPVEGYNDVVADAVNSSNVRFVKIPSVMSMTPLKDANCKWEATRAPQATSLRARLTACSTCPWALSWPTREALRWRAG